MPRPSRWRRKIQTMNPELEAKRRFEIALFLEVTGEPGEKFFLKWWQAPAKMFSSRVSRRDIKPRPRQNFLHYHQRQT
jgi:hypothetical protein